MNGKELIRIGKIGAIGSANKQFEEFKDTASPEMLKLFKEVVKNIKNNRY